MSGINVLLFTMRSYVSLPRAIAIFFLLAELIYLSCLLSDLLPMASS